jgi:hypothetical protein
MTGFQYDVDEDDHVFVTNLDQVWNRVSHFCAFTSVSIHSCLKLFFIACLNNSLNCVQIE